MSEKLDQTFGLWAARLYDNPLKFLFLTLCVIGLMIFQLHTIRFDSSMESFLNNEDPAIVTYDRFRNTYGRDSVLMIGIETDNAYDLTFLTKLKALHRKLEETLPYYDDINSLINARNVYGENDELYVDDLMDPFPETEQELEKIKRLARANKTYQGYYISEDETIVNIVIRFRNLYRDDVSGEFKKLGDVQLIEIMNIAKVVIAGFEGEFSNIYLAGAPPIVTELTESIQKDMRLFTSATLVIIGIFLFVLFRRWTGILVPMITVVLSAVLTISLMAIFDQPIQTPTAILPSFILAVGVGDSVHFLTHFYRELNVSHDKRNAMIHSYKHVGLPMLFTSLTTAAGLLSFSTADIVPVANIGIFAAGGVIIAFVLTMVLTPILLSLLPISVAPRETEVLNLPFFDKMFVAITRLTTQHAGPIIVICLSLMVLAGFGIKQLHFSHNPLYWFSEESGIRQATAVMDGKMGGTVPMEVLVSPKNGLDAKSPQFLQQLDAVRDEVMAVNVDGVQAGKLVSFTDLVKESNSALNDNVSTFYRVPDERAVIAAELFLLEMSGSDDLYRMVDKDYKQVRNTLLIPWVDALRLKPFETAIADVYNAKLGEFADVTLTGLIPVLARTLESVMVSTAKSYVLALVVISFMMIVLMASFKYGAISMIPNVFPIVLVMGFMHLIDAPLDMFTMLIGSIAIGLAVDDTVHFMHTFRRFHDQGLRTEEAIEETLKSTGRAMLVTSVVLSMGFFVYMLSDMSNLFSFGLLTGLCIIMALLADFILAPALMMMLHKKR